MLYTINRSLVFYVYEFRGFSLLYQDNSKLSSNEKRIRKKEKKELRKKGENENFMNMIKHP